MGQESYNQSTTLLVYRILLSELDPDESGYPERVQKMGTDLLLDDGVPDVLRNFGYRICVRVVRLVSNGTGSLQNGLQLVLDFFESPVVALTEELAGGASTKRTRIRSSSV